MEKSQQVIELSITVNGKLYTTGNSNEYQRVLLSIIEKEQEIYSQLKANRALRDALIKQKGVVEHYTQMLPLYDGIEHVEHLWEPKLKNSM